MSSAPTSSHPLTYLLPQAFERVQASTHHGTAKKGSLWRLTAQALQEGVISTTRYRKDPKRKPERRSSPALKRQISGAKGGQATRAASQHRRAMQQRLIGRKRNGHLHRNDPHVQHYYGSSTSAGSGQSSTLPSPHPFAPQPHHIFPPLINGLPRLSSAPSSHPTSPYFPTALNTEHFIPASQQDLTADPYTPPQVQLGFETGTERKTSGLLTEFELQHIDHELRPFFGNSDEGLVGIEDAEVETPSLTTEASFFSEERGSVEPVFV